MQRDQIITTSQEVVITDKYYINEKSEKDIIGRGGYGVVVKGTHKKSGLVRAIKIVEKKGMDERKQKELFSEQQFLKRLDHPNIVKLIECYEDKNRFYFVQEYLTGNALMARFIEKNGNFTEDYVRKLMLQILNVINYLHKMKCCHRDIKADNFVFESESSDSLKLIDFGLSSGFINPSRQTLLRMKTPVGTAFYAAPEVYKQELYSEICDIWSAGKITLQY